MKTLLTFFAVACLVAAGALFFSARSILDQLLAGLLFVSFVVLAVGAAVIGRDKQEANDQPAAADPLDRKVGTAKGTVFLLGVALLCGSAICVALYFA